MIQVEIVGMGLGDSTMGQFRLVCFLKEEPETLFPLLMPLRFYKHRDGSLCWQQEGVEFSIHPFATRGRESMGYRVYYNGTPEGCQFLMDQTLARFDVSISGIEWIHQTEMSQRELIQLAEKGRMKRGSMPGFYEVGEIGVVLMPDSTIHLQIRNRIIPIGRLAQLLQSINEVAEMFRQDTFDLFSLAEYEERGAWVS